MNWSGSRCAVALANGVASAFHESVDAVTECAREAQGRGIEIVGVSVLADVPN